MRAITEQQKQEAIAAFAYEGTLIADTVYGSGHINDTFRLTFAVGNMGDLDVILQRMNADAFPHPEQLMENIAGVTGFLKKKIIARGGDPERETLNIIPTVDNKPYYRDTNGDYWRSYRLSPGRAALIRWKRRSSFMRARSHSAASSGFWRIIRQRHSMRQFRGSTTRGRGLRHLKKPSGRMLWGGPRRFKRRSLFS